MNEVQDLLNAKARIEGNTSNILGSLVWWGNYEAKVSPADLKAAALASGLDPKMVPDHPGPREAFKRAVSDGASGIKEHKCEIAWRSDASVFATVLMRTLDSRTRVHWLPVGKVRMDVRSEIVHVEEAHPACDKIVSLFSVYNKVLMTEDIRKMVEAVMKAAGAISMTAAMGGGGHINSRFVPVSGSGLVDALRGTLEKVPGAHFFVIRVPNDPISTAAVQQITKASLDSEVREVEQEVFKFLGVTPDPSDTRSFDQILEDAFRHEETRSVQPDALRNRIRAFKEIEERSGLLADTLAFKAGDLQAKTAAARRVLMKMVGIES